MEELGKALAEAIRAGAAVAPQALWGYYAIRVIEALTIPLTFMGVVAIITRTVRYCVSRDAAHKELQLAASALSERAYLRGEAESFKKVYRELLVRVDPAIRAHGHATTEIPTP